MVLNEDTDTASVDNSISNEDYNGNPSISSLGPHVDNDEDLLIINRRNTSYHSTSTRGNAGDSTDGGNCSGSWSSRFIHGIKSVTVEPLMFLHMLGMTINTIVIQNLYIDGICKHILHYNETICDNLTSNHFEETQVDGQAAIYTNYRNIIESGLPIVFSLFLGPWSDKHGTKFPMILPLVGYSLSSLIFLILSQMDNSPPPPSYLLIASVPIALTGGMISLVLSAFSFISKKSTTKKRTIRIALVENSWFLASPIGLYSGSKIMESLGYVGVFIISGSCYTLALIYGIFFIHEEKKVQTLSSIEESRRSLSSSVIITALSGIKETFITCFRKRQGPYRRWIILLFLAICFRIFTLFGLLNIMFLYTRSKLNWNAADYSQYSTIDSILNISGGNIAALLFMLLYQVQDVKIGLLSSLGYTVASLIYAFASKPWMMYFGAVTQMFCGLITIIIRSVLSKCVSKDELGKVFSLLASFEALMPIFAGPIYSILFKSTVEEFPGAVFLLSAFLNFNIFIIFLYFLFSLRRHRHEHEEFQNHLQ